MPEDIAIRVDGVSKDFRLPLDKHSSLKSKIVHAFGKTKGYQIQHALKDVSFEIKKGEFFGIVGRNGSGKSTLLKMIAGIYQPTKGKISVSGKLVPFIELGVGFNPELTGRENVFLNGALLGFSNEEVAEIYDDIVEFAELEKFMDQKLKNYSSGMQVRLAFSMAIRAKADILLIDEVLAVGDADFQRKCFEYFKFLKKEKKTVVFVSHDMSAVREYCDRAMLIDGSEQKRLGLPNEVAEDYLKLFNESLPKSHSTAGGGSKRWGDKAVEIQKVEVSLDDKKIQLQISVKANRATDNYVLGFRIRSSDGKEVTGTNTKKEKIELGSLKKGKTITLKWEIPNVLSEGLYFIDPAVTYEDEITVMDWWDEAKEFFVKRDRTLPYAVDLNIKATIKS
jgi:ABC-2 type transport system ATP-binding protein